MLTIEENELLCRVEGDAPMGQMMRRHWTPVCLIEEVSEPDGAPVKARVFGEDLVVFRDTDGNVGVMDEYCPHRRVSLVYGRNEDCGLRCLYHGWKMDVKGNVIEMVSEPSCSDMTKKVKHKAYETKEWGGFVWAYMGPQDAIPEFVPPAWAPTQETRVSIAKAILPCNWAQILEGAIDSAHSSSLHSSDFVPARVGGAEGNVEELAAAVDGQGAAYAGASHELRLSVCCAAPADPERRDARLYPLHGVRRSGHCADTAEQSLQRREHQRAGGRYEHRVLLHGVGPSRQDA